MIRKFTEECSEAYQEFKDTECPDPKRAPVRMIIPTGISAFPYIRKMAEQYAPSWVRTEVVPVPNRFFGDTITVTGLIVGKDLLAALENKEFDLVLISESMLKENSECFLDDMTLEQVRESVGKPVWIVRNTGASFISALYMTEDAI